MDFLNPSPTVFPTVQPLQIPLPLDQYSPPSSQFVSEHDGESIPDSQKDSVSMIKKLFKSRKQLLETPVKKVPVSRTRATKPKKVSREQFGEISFDDTPLRVLDKSKGKLDVAVMKCCAGKLVWTFEEGRMILKMCNRCVDLNRGYARILD
ncbi:hypothetical protein GCK72_021813 [Caenorhabditis remanei]|uniref:Uncharacterized protein n=1 Tax=Caenorhabditis remanei TaxID=31234 RepID=A0A6A5GKK8_CAERE|nr:hypothetical protein GCK72_021810 [Caenorhabditis remanei]XP_053583421.1 hypothetical protein GCK72_021813 [Caenorhabditis remanei]KAF1755241.1 hypothetical protein GCK72_021810 [Caenorhabditis remanei]KAF1755244.1 hypothetical protein GCK72_021813 [Caenorhabditis remanei]